MDMEFTSVNGLSSRHGVRELTEAEVAVTQRTRGVIRALVQATSFSRCLVQEGESYLLVEVGHQPVPEGNTAPACKKVFSTLEH
ncbi:hypothetical protein AO926_29670 [Pseudomonas aeruginosa]|nr:hypothetical protein AO926_29670 [Pseudomonas aeruginosa]OPD93825.1 hypothetical protein AO987_29605 [Pseudomonas aeruginosa]